MIQAESGCVLAIAAPVGPVGVDRATRTGAGSVSSARREARPDAGPEAKIRLTSAGGKLVASACMLVLGR
jgi:hypothetical protein